MSTRAGTAQCGAAAITVAVLSAGLHAPACADSCSADISGDRIVDAADLAVLLAHWGACASGSACAADLTGDDFVNGADISVLLAGWGACPARVPTWATLLEADPDPGVVLAEGFRTAIHATGLAWRVAHTATGIEMVLIPAGSFTMGCQPSGALICPAAEVPVHDVTLTSAYYIGRYEVTQSQWSARMGSNPSAFQGPGSPDAASRPVEMVSWQMADEFVRSAGLRLPTEAEWERACRAGALADFHGSPSVPGGTGTDSHLAEIAWFAASSSMRTHQVGSKAGNGFGLHDMSGNVAEWVSDWYAPTYSSWSPVTDPTGPSVGASRVLRGGHWSSPSVQCRSASRGSDHPASASVAGAGQLVGHGFRVARSP